MNMVEFILEPVEAPTIAYEDVIRILQSKDIASDEIHRFEHLLENGSIFFDGKSHVPKYAFASLLRSGNTLLRKILENVTGIVTGSAFTAIASCHIALINQGLKGEAYTNDHTWFIKTHHPYNTPLDLPFKASKVICCVRNPYDCIASHLQFCLTFT